MSPLPGILASQISGYLNSYESIATVSIASTATTVTFSSIPQNYKHLQLRAIGKFANTGGTDITHYMRFNGSASGYSWTNLNAYWAGTGSVNPNIVNSTTEIGYAAFPTSASNIANMFGGVICDIFDYSNTNKNTTIRSLGTDDGNTVYGNVDFRSGGWYNTAAVTQIDLGLSATLVQYSHFALYGIKG
jgi:hypothetical protein